MMNSVIEVTFHPLERDLPSRLFALLPMWLPDGFAWGVQWGSRGSEESPLLPASLGFLANRTIGPEVHARHRMAAGLSARVLARMRQMETG